MSHRNWVGMIELSYIPENEIVRLSFPTKVDHVTLTMDQIDSLASILKGYVEEHHDKVLKEMTPHSWTPDPCRR